MSFIAYSAPLISVNYELKEKEIADGLYVRKLQSRIERKNIKGTVIVIPGGPFWKPTGARIHGGMVATFLPEYEVFIIGLRDCVDLHSMLAVKYARKCIGWIKKNRKNKNIPVHLIGSSVGGLVLAWYLRYKYNQADYYYMWSSSINIDQFYKGIEETFWLRTFITVNQRYFKPEESHIWDPKKIVPYLRKKQLIKNLEKVKPKNLTVVFGANDSICDTTVDDFKNIPAHLIKVKDGFHCCWYTIAALANAVKTCGDAHDVNHDAKD